MSWPWRRTSARRTGSRCATCGGWWAGGRSCAARWPRSGVTVRAEAISGDHVVAVAADLGEEDRFPLRDVRRVVGWRAFVRGTVAEIGRDRARGGDLRRPCRGRGGGPRRGGPVPAARRAAGGGLAGVRARHGGRDRA